MKYVDFYNKWFKQGIFNVYEVQLWQSGFDPNNLTRWLAKGYLIRLRRGWYAFPEALKRPDYQYLVAERIYRPSYISLQTAFGIYDMIPEAVFGITSVTSLKTCTFDTSIARYSYSSLRPELMFGYKPILTDDNRAWYLAHPEKALLDYLYLNPQYYTEQNMEELRFDEYFMNEELDIGRLDEYLSVYGSKSLSKRVETLKKVYGMI